MILICEYDIISNWVLHRRIILHNPDITIKYAYTSKGLPLAPDSPELSTGSDPKMTSRYFTFPLY